MADAVSKVTVETSGRIALITLNRPEAMNALDHEAIKALAAAFKRFDEDPELWVAILTGAGDRSFCAGTDLKWRAANPEAAVATPNSLRLVPYTSKPVIAAVNGFAVGGGLEIALYCDIIILADHAKLALLEPRRGVLAAGGGVHLIMRQLPWHQAMGLLLTGRTIGADEAFRMGLCNEVVPMEALLDTARRWADQILLCAPLAVRATKETAVAGFALPFDEAMATTFPLHAAMRTGPDFMEGSRAFAEKRAPRWQGR